MEEDKNPEVETNNSVVEEAPATEPTKIAKPKALPVKKSKKKKQLIGSTGLAILLVIALLAAAFFYNKYQDSQNKLKHPEVVAKAQTESLVDKVSKHVELPVGESPTIATVSDVSKLANQTFFSSAKNGDKVLIYSKAKKAVLYRPADDKVINVAPLNLNNGQ